MSVSGRGYICITISGKSSHFYLTFRNLSLALQYYVMTSKIIGLQYKIWELPISRVGY